MTKTKNAPARGQKDKDMPPQTKKPKKDMPVIIPLKSPPTIYCTNCKTIIDQPYAYSSRTSRQYFCSRTCVVEYYKKHETHKGGCNKLELVAIINRRIAKEKPNLTPTQKQKLAELQSIPARKKTYKQRRPS